MKRAEIAALLVKAKRLADKSGVPNLAKRFHQAIASLNQPLKALVVSEGDTGEGGIIRVILTPEVPAAVDLADLCAYGCQCAKEIGPDECDSAAEVEAIFNEMNPDDDYEDANR